MTRVFYIIITMFLFLIFYFATVDIECYCITTASFLFSPEKGSTITFIVVHSARILLYLWMVFESRFTSRLLLSVIHLHYIIIIGFIKILFLLRLQKRKRKNDSSAHKNAWNVCFLILFIIVLRSLNEIADDNDDEFHFHLFVIINFSFVYTILMCVRMSFHHHCHIVLRNTCGIDLIQDHHIRKHYLNLKKIERNGAIFFLWPSNICFILSYPSYFAKVNHHHVQKKDSPYRSKCTIQIYFRKQSS